MQIGGSPSFKIVSSPLDVKETEQLNENIKKLQADGLDQKDVENLMSMADANGGGLKLEEVKTIRDALRTELKDLYDSKGQDVGSKLEKINPNSFSFTVPEVSFRNLYRSLSKDTNINSSDYEKLKSALAKIIDKAPEDHKKFIKQTLELPVPKDDKEFESLIIEINSKITSGLPQDISASLSMMKRFEKYNKAYEKSDAVQIVEGVSFTPHYNENDAIFQDNKYDGLKIPNIVSQNDLNESGSVRCAVNSMFNAKSILSGNNDTWLKDIMKNNNCDPTLTFKSIHDLQDKLYQKNNQGEKGFNQITPSEDITNTEFGTLAKDLNLKVTNVKIDDPKIKDFLENKNPDIALVISVKSGNVEIGADDSISFDSISKNHAVTIFKKDGEYFMANSGGANKNRDNIRPLKNDELEQILIVQRMIIAVENIK